MKENSKINLIKELEELRKNLNESVLTEGEETALKNKISKIEQEIRSIEFDENTTKLQSIIDNNKKTSKNTLILSFLMILLSFLSIYKTYSTKEIDYTTQFIDLLYTNSELINKVDILEFQLSLIKNNTDYLLKIDSKLDTIYNEVK